MIHLLARDVGAVCDGFRPTLNQAVGRAVREMIRMNGRCPIASQVVRHGKMRNRNEVELE